MFKNYFKIAARNFLKTKGFSLINVAGLSAGLAVVLIIGLWIKDELSYNTSVPQYNKIVQVLQNQTTNGKTETQESNPLVLADEIRKSYPDDFKYIAQTSWTYDQLLTYDKKLNEEIGPQVFTMKPKKTYGLAFVRYKPNTQTASLQHIEAVFKKMFPMNPFIYKFKDLENLRAYESEAKWKQMMLFAAVLTIFISCIGLFGLSVLAAEKRIKEIGIRKVLGASISGIAAALSKDFLKLVTIAMLIAMPVAWYFTNQWLQNYAYRIELSWQMFAMAGLLVLMIALITVSFQAIKAALGNPVKALRSE